MCKHEQKNCPRCGNQFECKVGDISNCQCYAVQLNDKEIKFIAERYVDCLCAACMKAMKSEYSILQRELQLKVFLTGR
jgi:uncharacterized protein (UPF0212 family)